MTSAVASAMKQCDASTPYYQDYTALIQQLRCPVCDGQRINSSDAPFALSVKRDVCTMLHEGVEIEQIIPRIEADYGQSLRVESGFLGDVLPLALVGLVMLVVAGIVVRKLVTF